MKSPSELAAALRRQWENADKRESRLPGAAESWPLEISIGRPAAKTLANNLDLVKEHIAGWRNPPVGEVVWEPIRYRAAAEAVDIPVRWILRQPTDWVAACADRRMREEFSAMTLFAEHTDARFHSLLIRRRSLWRGKSTDEVLQAARLALALQPGIAEGRPLRMLSLEGIDTKFFERHGRLVTALLDVRFDGDVSRIGLESFLGAMSDTEHWLLVIDLDGDLLPFQKLRIRSSELAGAALPGSQLIIIENERCQHHLPSIPDTVAVLGAGFDLAWTAAEWVSQKRVAYWGDIDTWGLKFLATARESIQHLDALLMDAVTFEEFATAAVPEPVVAGPEPPAHLTTSEQALYHRLLKEAKGRLEQEFLPEQLVRSTLFDWAAS